MGNETREVISNPRPVLPPIHRGTRCSPASQRRDRSLVEGTFSQNTSLSAEWAVQDKVVAAHLNAILDGPDAWLSAVARVA
jgi:hypothetical protein